MAVSNARLVVEQLLGAEIGRTFHVYPSGHETRTYTATVPGALFSDTTHLGSTNKSYSSGPFEHEPMVTHHADGTRTVWLYETNSSGRTTVTCSGEAGPAGETNVIRGTRSVSAVGLYGEPLSSVTFDIASGILVSSNGWSGFDEFRRATTVTRLGGLSETVAYDDCCGVSRFTDTDGSTTTNRLEKKKGSVLTIDNDL